ncbi:MAG: hypothetical protein M3Z92_11025 [Bacteroidota bacterium]|nr:hypothetical protein [Bacteroidota bacterium]
MIRHIYKWFILFALISCQSNSGKNNDVSDVEVEDTVHDATSGEDSALMIKNQPNIWTAKMDTMSNSFKIYRPVNMRLDTLSGEKLVYLINNAWDSIHLDFIKSSHDTVYVSIPKSDYLIQRIGSTGAENYMATATFSLTEMKGIKYVNYKFTEGDHATPGVYSRDDFKSLQ